MTSASSPNLLSANLWSRCETHFLKAFSRALELLNESPPTSIEETALNRELYFCLLKACRELDPQALYPPPVAECCNQPDPNDLSRAERESKRPDFSWGFFDPNEPDATRSAMQFVIECKRIGIPSSKQWILNENYVNHGVRRFVDPAWSYAKRFPSALMIGYWQTMTGADALQEINSHLGNSGLSQINLSSTGWQIATVTKLHHILVRQSPGLPLALQHLWLDMRVFSESKTVDGQ